MPLSPPLILPLPTEGAGSHRHLALSPAGDRLAVGLGTEVLVYELPGPAGPAPSDPAPSARSLGRPDEDSYARPCFAPDGAIWAGPSRRDPDSGAWTRLLTLPEEHGAVRDLAFLPDGRMIIARRDGAFFIVNNPSQTPLQPQEIGRAHV